MSKLRSVLLAVALLLLGDALPAVVLPRPPSSPNFIPHEYALSLAGSLYKEYPERVTYQQSTNVEKPETQDFRFVEVELRDADNVESLDLHDLVRAVLENQPHQASDAASRARFAVADEPPALNNLSYPQPEVVPRSILGVRDVGLGPSQRLLETQQQQQQASHYLFGPAKNLGDEKLYYLKNSRPKVYVNFRGRTGNRQQQDGPDSRVAPKLEPAAYLRTTQPYRAEKKPAKSSKRPAKKYDPSIHGSGRAVNSRTSSATTTENTMVTSSELPKQIPAPPSRIPSRSPIVHTTPVQRFTARRTDILPGYAFAKSA